MFFDFVKTWKEERKNTIGFFHPQCCNFGGGEKVLWSIIYEVLNDNLKNKVVIYSSCGLNKVEIVKKVEEIFMIPLNSPEFIDRITIAELKLGFLLKLDFLKLWSVNIAAVIVSLEGLLFSWPFPKVFVETAGFPFSLISARILPTTKHISTYIHYPQVRKEIIENEKRKNILRYFYLKLFSFVYKFSIGLANKIVVNSNWTFGMLSELWGRNSVEMSVCYPPINMNYYSLNKPVDPKLRRNIIVSLSQFRAEKNHFVQIKIFSGILKRIREIKDMAGKEEKVKFEKIYKELKFKMCGTSQDTNPKYIEYLKSLRQMAIDEKLEDKLELIINSSSSELQNIMNTSRFAIHTMEDEHFGICVAEFVCSGLLTFAHKSGGPEKDILAKFKGSEVGFLESNVQEFVEDLTNAILHYEDPNIQNILNNAHESVLERYQDNNSFGKTCWKALNI
ncbi:glycosyl transferase [Cryptosporidium ubiquitum]|uniref:GDP-Man:Man(3)GlcNAc(2)-PP-Dol alpha-1,2-mannosyltransferase n=1 Tax=Cryptosporidium ubiquitum TaxID=857276 RepID=A0A1J4MDR3_9CRYT|nr:glycosyl transferase [Cryptosporidium ubiquitum]OII72127.1 glycosyl transferase [Cryptosporidium ubiquitum]